MPRKIDNIELEKRIRAVQEWIIDDWPYTDIVKQIITKYDVQERQAKRYIKEAKDRWVKDEDENVERKKAMKIQSLKKLKRSLHDRYKGTPQGITAVLGVEKELIKLEGLEAPTKVEVKDVTDLTKLPITFS